MLWGLINLPPIQQKLVQEATDFVAQKTGTRVEIGAIDLDFFHTLVLEDVFLNDLQQDTLLAVDRLGVKLGVLHLLRQEIHVNRLSINGLTSHIRRVDSTFNFQFLLDAFASQDTAPAASAPPEERDGGWRMGVSQISLKDISLRYDDQTAGMLAEVYLGELGIGVGNLDLKEQRLGIEEITWEESRLAYEIFRPSVDTAAAEPLSFPATGWTIGIEEIAFSELALRYRDHTQPAADSGFDPGFVQLDGLSLGVDSVLVNDTLISAQLRNLAFQERSGLALTDLQANFAWSPVKLALTDLRLQTPYSRLRAQATLQYPNLAVLAALGPELRLMARVEESAFDLRDAAFFAPTLRQSLRIDRGYVFRFSADMVGTPAQLSGQLGLSSGNLAQLQSRFELKDWGQPASMHLRLNIDSLRTQLAAVDSLLVTPLPPEALALGTVTALARYKGGTLGGDFSGRWRSAPGQFNHRFTALFSPDYQNATYEGNFSLDHFNLGTLLGNDSLGQFTFAAELAGEGLSLEDLDTQLDAVVSEAEILGYAYQDLELHGRFEQQRFLGAIDLRDPNLKLDFDGEVNLNDSLPEMRFVARLDTLDLQALNLSETPLAFSTALRADLRGNSVDNLSGYAQLDTLWLRGEGGTFYQDSIRLDAGEKNGNRRLALQSEMARMELTGDFQVAQLGASLQAFVNDYFPLESPGGPIDTLATVKALASPDSLPQAPAQRVDFRLTLHEPDRLLAIFVPELQTLDSLQAAFQFDSEAENLEGSLRVPRLVYSGNQTDSLRLRLHTDRKAIVLALNLDSIRTEASPQPLQAFAGLRLGDQRGEARLQLARDSMPALLRLGVEMSQMAAGYQVQLLDTFALADQFWQVAPDHQIRIDSLGVAVEGLQLSQGTQEIFVDGDLTDSLVVQLKGLKIAQFSDLAQIEGYDLAGQISGEAKLMQLSQQPYYLADLQIDSISLNEERIGELLVEAQTSQDGEQVRVDSRLQGEADLRLSGTYGIEASSLDLQTEIGRLPLPLLKPFTSGFLSETEGDIFGQLDLQGTAEKPEIEGFIGLRNAATRIDYSNTYYRFSEEKVLLSPTAITFNRFTFTDSLGNQAVLNGKVTHQYFENFALDLAFNSKKFPFLNTQSGDNDLFYGKMLLNLQAQVTGTPDAPVVKAQARTLPGTALTVMMPEDEESVIQEDYVLFVSPEQFAQTTGNPDTVLAVPATYQADIDGLNLDLRLELDPETRLTYIIDPLTGDQVTVSGDAQLTISMNPAGEISIVGNYTVTEGTYRFSFESVVTKTFRVRPGSRITFAGDPLDARLDLTAIYTARTPTYELIRNELTDPNGPTARAAKRRSDVEVLLSIQGGIFTPDLSFDIQVPQTVGSSPVSSAVERKLAQLRENQSALNQQVFGLLLLGSFVGTGGSSGGTGLEGVAASSVSSFLSNELGRLADQYIKGVQVDINLESYQSSYDEQNTVSELQLGLSRQLFNERLSVSVGTEIGMETSSFTSSSGTELTQITGNFVLRYQLTENGRYNLRVFRKSDADDPLSGGGNAAIKTGFGASYRRAFD